MPFGVTLDFSTSTCWQSSGSFSVDWSSETHSIRMRISFQGTLLCICFQVDQLISQADLFHHLCHLRLCAHHPLGLAQWNWKRRGSSQILQLLILHIQTRLFLPRVLIMYLLAGLAFVFYIAKFPEVVLPGRYITPSFTRLKTSTDLIWEQLIFFIMFYSFFLRFDILGSSHQWWHIFIFLCLAYCKLLPYNL